MSETRTCSATGCTNKLTAANKGGRCTTHWYVPKGARTAPTTKPKPAMKPTRPRSKSAVSVPPKVSGELITMTLQVVPEWLELAWKKLDVQQKAQAIAAVLVA